MAKIPLKIQVYMPRKIGKIGESAKNPKYICLECIFLGHLGLFIIGEKR